MNEPLSVGGNEQQAVNASTSPAILQRLHQRLLQPYGAINTQQLHCHADRTQTLTTGLMQGSDLPAQIQSRYQLEKARLPESVSRFNGQRTESPGGVHYEMAQRVVSDDIGETYADERSQIHTLDSHMETVPERGISSPPKVTRTAPSSIQRKETPTPEIPSTTARSELFRVSRRAIPSTILPTISQSISESTGTQLNAETKLMRAEYSPDTQIEPSQTPASTVNSPISVQTKSDVYFDSGRQQATSNRQPEMVESLVDSSQIRDRTAAVLPTIKVAIPIQQPESHSLGKIRRSLSTPTQNPQIQKEADIISQKIDVLPTVKSESFKVKPMQPIESSLENKVLMRAPQNSDSFAESSELQENDRTPVSPFVKTESLPSVNLPKVKISATQLSSIASPIVQSKFLSLSPKSGSPISGSSISGNQERGVSREGNFLPPFVKPTLIQRQEDIAAPAEPPTPAIPPAAPPAATPASREVDVAEIAEQVSRILGRQMIVERERRGLNS